MKRLKGNKLPKTKLSENKYKMQNKACNIKHKNTNGTRILLVKVENSK